MTHRRVLTSGRADEDIAGAIEYYLQDGATDAALRFVDALESATVLLGEHPSIGSPRFAIETGIPELRSLTMQRFSSVILYTDDSDATRIHRVLLTGRDIPAELSESPR